MAFLTAGFIDGSQVSGEVLRRALWAATNGTTGIVGGADSLRVQALGTPGGAVTINPGGGVIQTMFADAASIQSYTVGNDSAYTLPVPANGGSSPKTWEVVVRVRDPQYAGETVPGSPLTDSYTTPELVATRPMTRPHLWLATIVIPKQTSAITNAMITDRRQLASARSYLEPVRVVNPPGNNDAQYNPYGNWPAASNLYQQTYQVPSWATSVSVTLLVNGIYLSGAAPVYGGIRLYMPQLGYATDHAIVYTEGTPSRVTVARGWTIAIPAARRGQPMDFYTQALNSKGNPTIMRADYQTQLTWDVRWMETL